MTKIERRFTVFMEAVGDIICRIGAWGLDRLSAPMTRVQG